MTVLRAGWGLEKPKAVVIADSSSVLLELELVSVPFRSYAKSGNARIMVVWN